MNEIAVIDQNTKVAQADAVTPPLMLQMAVEQGADVDKLTKLMDLQERWEANEAKKAFVAAMSKFRNECPPIRKTRKAHNSKYAGLAESIDQIKALMNECGLSHSWKTDQSNGVVSVTCIVTHVQGHSESTTLTAEPDNSGSKNSIQAIGSTVTYLERYTLFAILGIASTDQDDDGQAAGNMQYITAEQEAELDTLIDNVGANRAKFLQYFRIESLGQLPASQYRRAVADLNAKVKK